MQAQTVMNKLEDVGPDREVIVNVNGSLWQVGTIALVGEEVVISLGDLIGRGPLATEAPDAANPNP